MGVGAYNDGWKEEGRANDLVGVDGQVVGDNKSEGVGEGQMDVGEVGEHDWWLEVRGEVVDVGLKAHVQVECVGYEGALQEVVEGHGEWEGLNEAREVREVASGGEAGDSL